jgi:hypothetical protein
MQNRQQPGGDLSPMERSAIDNTVHDGSSWVLAINVPDRTLERMASKGLIELNEYCWRLTALGYACSIHATILYE